MRSQYLPLLIVACALLAAPAAAAQQQPVDLSVFNPGFSSPAVEAGEEFVYSFAVGARPAVTVSNIVLRVALPPGVEFVYASGPGDPPGGWTCSEEGGIVSCTASLFTPEGLDGDSAVVSVKASSSATQGAVLTATATVSSDMPDPDPSNNSATETRRVFRDYIVTSAGDSGEGSLREILQRAGDECDRDGVPCRILFHIPPPIPGTGWYTIDLASPLPPIAITRLVVDGTSQTAFTGDTNPAGPEVELRGHSLEQGNGIEVQAPSAPVADLDPEADISGLVINGFPENGLFFSQQPCCGWNGSVTRCYIGTDPTGTIAVPNGLRGVSSFGGGLLTIRSNVLSGNGRSGIFVAEGSPVIENNRIGVKAASDEPLPNGKSGIYLGIGSSYGCVDQNVIANNAEFGIALERQAYFIWIAQNSIKNNSLYGLDIGLDLASPDLEGPTLTSARYDDAAGLTTITGLVRHSDPYQIDTIDLYSNSVAKPNGEGDIWLGSVQNESLHDEFAFAFKGNLLGKTITATMTQPEPRGFSVRVSPQARTETAVSCPQNQYPHYYTSEFGPPILVTR